jgi:hypothetical protein
MEACIDQPYNFVDRRCEPIQQRSSKGTANIRPTRLAVRHFEPAACQKKVAGQAGGHQNSNYGATAVEEG